MSRADPIAFPVQTGLAAFDRWMQRADPQHFLRRVLPQLQDEQDGGSLWFVLTVWDELFRLLDDANPNRLDSKRRAFRKARTDEELLALRAELVVAARLIRAGESFEFGKPRRPQPDLVLTGHGLGIEVKARRVDGLWDLHNELEERLSAIGAPVTVHLGITERPLAIPPAKLQAVVERVLDMVAAGQTGSFSADIGHPRSTRPNLTMQVQVIPVPPVADQMRVYIDHGPWLTDHYEDIARVVMEVLGDEQKVRQAESMPTILAVDMTRTGAPWLRTAATWARAFGGRFPAETPWIGIAPLLLDLSNIDCEIALVLNPDRPAEVLASARSLAVAIDAVEISIGDGATF